MRAALAAAMVAACDSPPDYRTEQGQIGLRAEGLDGQTLERPRSTMEAVVGSRACLEFDGWFEEDGTTYHTRSEEPDDTWLRDCFELAPSAGVRVDGSCVVMDGVGQGKLGLVPTSCELEGAPPFVADALPVHAYGLDELALSYVDVAAQLVFWQEPGPAGAFIPHPARALGTPLRVLAGAPYTVVLQPMTRDDPSRNVAFSDAVEQYFGDTPVQFIATMSGSATLQLDAEQSLQIQLALPGGILDGDEVVGVDPALATDLQIVVGYAPCSSCTEGYGAPNFALAVIRDADGGELFGGDVRWSVDGEAVHEGALLDPGLAQLLEVDAGCDEGDVGAERSATLRAELGGLVASVELAYVCPDPAQAQDDWGVDVVDGDPAEFGSDCACDAGRREAPASSVAVLVLAVLARRRRR